MDPTEYFSLLNLCRDTDEENQLIELWLKEGLIPALNHLVRIRQRKRRQSLRLRGRRRLPRCEPIEPIRLDELKLTAFEYRVLTMFLEGYTQQEIADQYGYCQQTISRKLKDCMSKMTEI